MTILAYRGWSTVNAPGPYLIGWIAYAASEEHASSRSEPGPGGCR